MKEYAITKDILADIVEAVVLYVDYDVHKVSFKYEDDNGELKGKLNKMAFGILEREQAN